MLQKERVVFSFIMIIFFFCPITALCKQDWDIDARFILAAGNELEEIEYYAIEADVEFTFTIVKNIEFSLELEADRFEVDTGQMSLRWSALDYMFIKIGKFKPDLTLEDYIGRRKCLFSTKSLVADYIETSGYTVNNLGGKIYKNYKKKTLPLSYVLHIVFNTAHFEPQFITGLLYHFNKKDSYIGFIGSYIPFLFHDRWLSEDSGTTLHSFLIDLIFADYENSFVYGLELTAGSNLIDPVGILHFPSQGDYSFFAGADTHIGYRFTFDDFRWTPSLRYTILFPNIEIIECPRMEMILGNLLGYDNKVSLYLDGGVGINTFYNENKRYTQLELLWAAQLMVRY